MSFMIIRHISPLNLFGGFLTVETAPETKRYIIARYSLNGAPLSLNDIAITQFRKAVLSLDEKVLAIQTGNSVVFYVLESGGIHNCSLRHIDEVFTTRLGFVLVSESGDCWFADTNLSLSSMQEKNILAVSPDGATFVIGTEASRSWKVKKTNDFELSVSRLKSDLLSVFWAGEDLLISEIAGPLRAINLSTGSEKIGWQPEAGWHCELMCESNKPKNIWCINSNFQSGAALEANLIHLEHDRLTRISNARILKAPLAYTMMSSGGLFILGTREIYNGKNGELVAHF